MSNRALKKILVASIALLAAMPVAGEEDQSAAVKAAIRHHVEDLNSGDLAAISADWDAQGAIVDAFPPYLWAGAAPAASWWKDLQGAIKPAGLNKVIFSTDKWQRLDVRGDYAYAVADATALISGPDKAFRAKGTWTIILVRKNGAWRISAWSWGGPPSIAVHKP